MIDCQHIVSAIFEKMHSIHCHSNRINSTHERSFSPPSATLSLLQAQNFYNDKHNILFAQSFVVQKKKENKFIESQNAFQRLYTALNDEKKIGRKEKIEMDKKKCVLLGIILCIHKMQYICMLCCCRCCCSNISNETKYRYMRTLKNVQ